MNPVDHPHGGVSNLAWTNCENLDREANLLSRVTINILVRPLPSHDMPPKVKRLVLLPQGERVCYVVLKR
jgi:hypothetical protein